MPQKNKKSQITHLVGIDEAGRGPLAGPVSVGVVVIPLSKISKELFEGVRDSKKLTEHEREVQYRRLQDLKRKNVLSFTTTLVGNEHIDRCGITHAIRTGIDRSLRRLSCDPKRCSILLDGSLKAPEIYTYQQTIIRGDDSEPIISLASIAAKVRRDRYMKRIAGRYPHYNFGKHKGYGTQEHRDMLLKHGLSRVHRTSFLTRLQDIHTNS